MPCWQAGSLWSRAMEAQQQMHNILSRSLLYGWSRIVQQCERSPLTTDTSIITAAGNDFNFDCIFGRQIEALGRPGDVFLGISTSGNSKNILQAVQQAKEMDITNHWLHRQRRRPDGIPLRPQCDYSVQCHDEHSGVSSGA